MGLTSRNAQLGQLSEAIYQGAIDVAGYTFLKASPPNDSGMFAAAYREKATGKIVVVFRGTTPGDLGDDLADIALKTGGWHQQFDDAIEFVADIANRFLGGVLNTSPANLLVTGHSLGGALAQITGRLFGADGAAFDPVGAIDQIGMAQFRAAAQRVGVDPAANSIAATFRNYAVEGSLASSSSTNHVGTVLTLPQMYFPSILDVLKWIGIGARLTTRD